MQRVTIRSLPCQYTPLRSTCPLGDEGHTDSSEFTIGSSPIVLVEVGIIHRPRFPSQTDKLLFIRIINHTTSSAHLHEITSRIGQRGTDLRINTSEERCPQSDLTPSIGQTPRLPSYNRAPTCTGADSALLDQLSGVDIVFPT